MPRLASSAPDRVHGLDQQWRCPPRTSRRVQAAIDRYRAAVTELEAAADAGIAALADRLAAGRRGR